MFPVRRFLIILGIAALASLPGCQDVSAPQHQPPPAPPVARVWVAPLAIHLLVGATGIVWGFAHDLAGGALWDSLVTWKTSDPGVAAVLDQGHEVRVEGRGPGVAVVIASSGGKESAPILVTTLPAADLQAISVGFLHTCAVSAARTAYCWTADDVNPQTFGLGHSLVSTGCARASGCASIPLPVNTTVSFATVVAGWEHTCGLTPSGDAYCWGANGLDRGGTAAGAETCPDPDYPIRLVPCLSRPTRVSGGLTFVALSAGLFHTCGLTPEGEAACWGSNAMGLLGDTTADAACVDIRWLIAAPCSATPVRVAGGLRFTTIAAGRTHSCALTSEGTAYCWGSNSHGQLGVGSADTAAHAAPAAVGGDLRFVGLAAGATHTCGVVATEELYCWGSNEHAEVGDGLVPEACAISSGGYLWEYCQLLPRHVAKNLRFRAVSLTESNTCGITVGGAVYCWGLFPPGGGGGGGWHPPTPGYFPMPTEVSAVTAFATISNGGRLCGIGTDGIAYCASKLVSMGSGTPAFFPLLRVPGQP